MWLSDASLLGEKLLSLPASGVLFTFFSSTKTSRHKVITLCCLLYKTPLQKYPQYMYLCLCTQSNSKCQRSLFWPTFLWQCAHNAKMWKGLWCINAHGAQAGRYKTFSNCWTISGPCRLQEPNVNICLMVLIHFVISTWMWPLLNDSGKWKTAPANDVNIINKLSAMPYNCVLC